MTRSPVRLVGGLLLIAAAAVWLRLNGPVEGRVLFVVDASHGLTEADLLSFAAVALAVPLLATRR